VHWSPEGLLDLARLVIRAVVSQSSVLGVIIRAYSGTSLPDGDTQLPLCLQSSREFLRQHRNAISLALFPRVSL
jgi:hypothetical protein